MASEQLDLFPKAAAPELPPMPEGFVQRIRDELLATLALARAADGNPWPDLTKLLLEELRFKSVARWLPPLEAKALGDAFEAELARIYAILDARSEAAGADPEG
jgi:hypothetical protein